jgi:Serine dehydrogenase proteinase
LSGRIRGVGDPGESTEHRVQRRCEERFGFPKTPPENTINVILDSIGGPLDSAFRTVLYLSRYAETINVYVPRRAKSASTLITVGANAIFMSPFAELGPLDTQIRDPRNPADYMSALDCYQSVDYVRDFGFSTLSQALKHLAAVTQGKVPLIDSLNTAEEFAIGSITPMLTQTKSLDFGAWGRSLKIAERYAQVLLARRPEMDQARAAKIAFRLVYGYTHHLFPIDIVEAKDIGLNPKEMTAEQYASLVEIMNVCNDDLCVEFINEPDLIGDSGPPRSRVSPEGTVASQAGTAQVKPASSAKKARSEAAAHVEA